MNWNINNEINYQGIIRGCNSLGISKYISDISGWKIFSFKYFCSITKFCEKLNLDKISRKNIRKQIIKNYLSLTTDFYTYNINDISYRKAKNEFTNIFGENFVENNKDKCILIGEKIYQLTEKINYKTEKTFFEILFVELEKISNYSNMFSKSNLLTFKNIKEQNKISKNIENTEINNMKNNLDNSDDRKDIYKSLDTFIESTINEDDHKIFSNKATIINNDKMLSFYDFDVSYMFNECSLLKSLSLSN